MKKWLRQLLPLFLLPVLASCPGSGTEPIPMTSAYVPVLMSREQLEASVVKKAAQPIKEPGKLYLYGNYILINEQYKGVHLVDNHNPTAPKQIGFIQVPGSIDFAVKSNIMYVDNAVDLVAIDLNDLTNVRVTKRIRNALPALLPPDMLPLNTKAPAPNDAIIVGWETSNKN